MCQCECECRHHFRHQQRLFTSVGISISLALAIFIYKGMDKISDFYPFNSESSLLGSYVMCVDNAIHTTALTNGIDSSDSMHAVGFNSGGDFTLSMLMIKLLKQGHHVLIISANHGSTHFESILRKNSLDMNKLEANNQLKMIYLTMGSDFLCNGTINSSSSSSSNSDGVKHKTNTMTWNELCDWRNNGMKFSITAEANSMSDLQQQYYLCIDDLDAMELMSPSSKSTRKFMLCCHNQLKPMSSSKTTPLMGMVTFGRQSSSALIISGQDEPNITEYCKCLADIMVGISGLTTGYSSDVHGIITILMQTSSRKKQVLNFKALDSGVRCSVIGNKCI